MAKRVKLKQKTSQKVFASTGSKTNSMNMPKVQMRGGIRL